LINGCYLNALYQEISNLIRRSEEEVAKKNKKKLFFDQARSFKYRWEFLRRNNDYQNDYKNWLSKRSKKNFRNNSIIKKYGFYPIDYNRSYDELVKVFLAVERAERNGLNWDDIRDAEVGEFVSMGPTPIPIVKVDSYSKSFITKFNRRIKYYPIDALDPNKIKKANTIRLVFNIHQSEEQLLAETKEIIKECKKLAGGLSRNRYVEYDRYLQVYDLTKKGWSPDKLAKKFYKGDTEREDIIMRSEK